MSRYLVVQRPAHVTYYTVIVDTQTEEETEVGYTDSDDWMAYPPERIECGQADTIEQAEELANEYSEWRM